MVCENISFRLHESLLTVMFELTVLRAGTSILNILLQYYFTVAQPNSAAHNNPKMFQGCH